MLLGVVFGSMVVYAVGVFTGVYVGYSIRKHAEKLPQQTMPSEVDIEKILALASKREKITNNDVEKLLKVSDATATRYLNRLEERGELVQQGKTGRSVYYTQKNNRL